MFNKSFEWLVILWEVVLSVRLSEANFVYLLIVNKNCENKGARMAELSFNQ